MQPLVEHRDTFAGYGTRVLELEGDGPPLVFLHGFADSADTWRLALARLGKLGRRAVAVDLPGFANGDRLLPTPVLPQLERFAAAVVEAYSGDYQAVLVGNSLGGCTAIRVAQREGIPLAGIVPVGPAGLGLAPWLGLIEGNALIRFVLAAGAPLPRPVLQTIVGRAYRTLAFAPRAAVDPLVVSTFAGHFRDARTVRRYLHTARRVLAELHDPFELERIGVPVLLVWGRRDAMVPHRGSERLLSAVPGSRLELIETCGHCPQVEEPERFVDLVLEFAESPERVG